VAAVARRAVVDLGRGIDQFEDALRRGDRVLHFGVDARQVLHRPHHEGQVRDERVDTADGQQPALGLDAAVPDDRAQRERAR
jgi:hypothetical protein